MTQNGKMIDLGATVEVTVRVSPAFPMTGYRVEYRQTAHPENNRILHARSHAEAFEIAAQMCDQLRSMMTEIKRDGPRERGLIT